jgi:hypothetical protein
VANLTEDKKIAHVKKLEKEEKQRSRLGSKYKEKETQERKKVLSIGAMGK